MTQDAQTPFQVIDLTCEYFPHPMGLEVPHPRLSWKLHLPAANRRGLRQVAYRIWAASRPEALAAGDDLLWDTGRVESDQSIHVPYEGPALASRQQVWWQVQVWNEHGQMAESKPAGWEMGLLEPADWQARWIGAGQQGGKHVPAPAPYLRRSFTLERPARQARLYVTALGLHQCSLNGQPVSPDVLAPGWTDYNQRVQYQVYDVTALLASGENVLGAILGDGWYCGSIAWCGRQNYGDRPRLLAQLEIEHEDGSRTVIASDDTWRTRVGPILESDLLMGESYDARLELPGWDRPAYDDRDWQPVTCFPAPEARLVARRGPGVRRIEEIRPVAEPVRVPQHNNTRWIFDLGQNMVGWVRFQGQAPAGATITLRFAEILNEDGSLYTTNLRSARATDYYTFKGEGTEVFEPHFTFHGFRYVEVSGYPGELNRDSLLGVVVHSEMAVTGSFTSSDPLINQLQHNILWGQKGNFVDVPTDCPQRDERLGWTGDAQVFIRTAAFNMDVAAFFTKWVQDLADAQTEIGQIPPVAPNIEFDVNRDGGPAWADAFTICPWTIYLCYGDRQMLADHYPNIKRYVDHLVDMSYEGIRCHPDTPFQNGNWPGFGDWLSINAETPNDLIGTAFLAYSAQLLAEMAGVLGNAADLACYRQVAEDARAAFQRRYVTADGLVGTGSQTGYVLALHFDLLPEDLRPKAAAELVRDIKKRKMHLSTGFVGAPYLPHVLTRAGHNDIAYELLNQKSWPSWLYSVTQGATTIWERWDGWTHDKGFQDPGMNSFNHYAYGSIGAWLYNTVAGIELDPQAPACKHVHFQPQPGGGLTSAQAAYESLYGPVKSSWKIANGAFYWQVSVPPNTRATLRFPLQSGARLLESGRPLDQVTGLQALDDITFTAEPGEYAFTAPAEAVIGLDA